MPVSWSEESRWKRMKLLCASKDSWEVDEWFWEIWASKWHNGWLGWYNSSIINLNHRNEFKNYLVRRTRDERIHLGATTSTHVTLSSASSSCQYLEVFALVDGKFSWEWVQCVGRAFIPGLWASENNWEEISGEAARSTVLRSVVPCSGSPAFWSGEGELCKPALCVWGEGAVCAQPNKMKHIQQMGCRIAVFLLLLQTCTRVRGRSRGERSSLQLDGWLRGTTVWCTLDCILKTQIIYPA